MADEPVEKFRPTSGRVLGGIGLGLVALVFLLALLDPGSVPASVAWGFAFFGALVWSSMLRPRLMATPDTLLLRNMLSTVRIPFAAVEQVAVRQVLAVRAGDRRYVSPAVGRTWRQSIRSGRAAPGEAAEAATESYPTFVENRLHQLAEDARARAGVAILSDEQLALAADVRREWSWPTVGLVAATFAGFALSLLL